MAFVGACAICEGRVAAIDAGEFLYAPAHDGWIFPKMPRRVLSSRAQYFAYVERNDEKHPDCTGKPYVYMCCPWCGGEIPRQATMKPKLLWPGEGRD